MTQQQNKSQAETGFDVASDVVKAGQKASNLASGGHALGAGALHHAGMAVGGGAGSGFFAGKAVGFKLGLGLGGLGGPILFAAVCGAGGYALYRWAKQRNTPSSSNNLH